MEKYIFTFEDGRHFVSVEITEADKDCVTNGILTIIRCSDANEMDEFGNWTALPKWEDVVNG